MGRRRRIIHQRRFGSESSGGLSTNVRHTTVEARYYEQGRLFDYSFRPQLSDLAYLRTYKHVDMTFRGTVEFRSCCCQPLGEAMTVAAFHVGLMDRLPELLSWVQRQPLLAGDRSPALLRAVLNRRDWRDHVDEAEVSHLCLEMLRLSREGLSDRGFGEEAYLDPLFERARTLVSPARAYLEAREAGESVSALVRKYSLL